MNKMELIDMEHEIHDDEFDALINVNRDGIIIQCLCGFTTNRYPKYEFHCKDNPTHTNMRMM